MARTEIKLFKKCMRAGVSVEATALQMDRARHAAIFLLRRSVRMQHKQLTLVRLMDAYQLQAPIDEVLWRQCINIATGFASTQELRMLNALRQNAALGNH